MKNTFNGHFPQQKFHLAVNDATITNQGNVISRVQISPVNYKEIQDSFINACILYFNKDVCLS